MTSTTDENDWLRTIHNDPNATIYYADWLQDQGRDEESVLWRKYGPNGAWVVSIDKRPPYLSHNWKTQPATAVPLDDLVYWQSTIYMATGSIRYGIYTKILITASDLLYFCNTQQVVSLSRSTYGSHIVNSRPDIPTITSDINSFLRSFGLPGFTVDDHEPSLSGFLVWLGDKIIPT